MSKKKNISLKDLKTWQEYIKNPKDIFDKDNSQKNEVVKKRYKFDLHGFSLLEANKKVKEIIFSCLKNKFREILFITGKGIHSDVKKNIYSAQDLSKLRFAIPEYIKSDEDIAKYVSSISTADRNDGGDGAIVVKLKKL